MTGPLVTPLRRSFGGMPVLRREPTTVKERTEQYKLATSGSGKAADGPPKESPTGIGSAAFTQRSEAFSAASPTAGSGGAARPPVQGLRSGAVGLLAQGAEGRATPEKLMESAGYEWVTVKEMFGSDTATMTALVNYRKQYVDGLITDLRNKDKRFATMETRAAGSTALTSDYDITFLGIHGAAAVQEFNRLFRRHWLKEAGTVFDTNVYAEDVLPSKAQVLSKDHDLAHLGDPVGADNVDARLDEGLQDVSSLVKVRKNMKRSDWFAFVDTILQALRADRAATAEAASRFADANTIYERTMVPEIIKQVEGTDSGRTQLTNLRKKGITTEVAQVEEIMKVDEGVAASNRVYEAKLLTAADLEARRNLVDRAAKPREWNSLTADLRKAKADAMLFANEPYFSAGTLFHVVGNVQAKFGATLGSAAYFQSLQENYGDTLKELHHLHGKAWPVIAIKASKYVWRTFDAALQMEQAGVNVSGGLPLAALSNAAKMALDVRQGAAAGQDAALEALKGAGIGSEDQLASVLGKLVTAANLAVRGGKPSKPGADKAEEGTESESTED